MKAYVTFFLLFLSHLALGQRPDAEKVIELGKAYKTFMFRTEPPKGFAQNQVDTAPAALQKAASFIAQVITTDNKLLQKEYLTLPDEQTLAYLFAIRQVNYNIRKEKAIDNHQLLDSLQAASISRNELVDCYYDLLFTSVGNKNRPFNFSKYDFKLNEYGLANDTEKGIFFLECMQLCGSSIWGYMNIVKPPNTKEAYAYIKRYPHFNGLKYFQYTDLSFPDFQLVIIQDKGLQSYKSFYLNKYYDTLLYHLICLHEQHADKEAVNDLLLSSILKDHSLYKYSSKKELLEKIFQEQKP